MHIWTIIKCVISVALLIFILYLTFNRIRASQLEVKVNKAVEDEEINMGDDLKNQIKRAKAAPLKPIIITFIVWMILLFILPH